MEVADICSEVSCLEINKTIHFLAHRRTLTSTIWYILPLETRRSPCYKYHSEFGETENWKWKCGLVVSSKMVELFKV